MQTDQKKTIICTAVGSMASVGLIKLIKGLGFRIIGTDITEVSVGRSFVDKFYVVPRGEEKERVVEAYESIAKKEDAAWIFSGPETELVSLVENIKSLNNAGVDMLHPPLETLNVITDKLNLHSFCVANGFDAPLTYRTDDCRELVNDGEANKLVLKPRKGRGSSGVIVVEPKMVRHAQELINRDAYIIQKYIDGEEYTVDILCDFDGIPLNIIPRKRLKTDSGICVVGQTVRDFALIDIVQRITKLMKFVGGACMQFIKDKENVYHLTDINPRFGGGSILSFRASESMRLNLRGLMYRDSKSVRSGNCDFKEMMMYRYYDEFFH